MSLQIGAKGERSDELCLSNSMAVVSSTNILESPSYVIDPKERKMLLNVKHLPIFKNQALAKFHSPIIIPWSPMMPSVAALYCTVCFLTGLLSQYGACNTCSTVLTQDILNWKQV